jgi:ankyrin repeat protein
MSSTMATASGSYVTASETSWWSASGTEWVTAIEYASSARPGYESSTIASFTWDERPTRAPSWRTALTNSGAYRILVKNSRRELIRGIQADDLDLVIKLLDRGVEVNFEWQQHCPLAYAIASGSETIVKLLIEAGADVSFRLANQLTLLHLALKFRKPGQLEIVKLLVNAGADLFAIVPPIGGTLLHYAVMVDWVNPQIVEYLLESGLSPSSLTRYLQTPLHWAMYRSAKDEASKFQALRILLHRNRNVLDFRDDRAKTALEMAMDRLPPSCEDVLFLLEIGADCHVITRSGGTALHLLLKNATPWILNQTRFRAILDVLVAKGADLRALIRTDRKTVFDVTVRKFKLDILESLLRIQPAPVSIPDARGNTPLHLILEAQPPPREYRSLVQHLILTNANLFARNMKLRTPLMSACANPYVDSSVLADLICAGSDVNDECESGENPMTLVLASSLIYGDLATPPGYDVPSWKELRSTLRMKTKVLENAGFKSGPYLASDGYRRLFGHS